MSMTIRNTTRLLTGTFLGTALAFSAMAADPAYKAAKDNADATYERNEAYCEQLTGNDKDVCMKQAKANKTSADANAKTQHETRDAAKDAHNEKMEAQYKVAKEKCDALSGDAKDACVSRAKATYNQ